ncbi:nuclear receptor coactivator 5-like isoform X2 [Prorops nasuta]|uniref:nuclear receptor coactivator 5-like isoform X2 n=1 Tax=Prorops nasuta TaxID=863751 RepID=UPI0034CEC119
MSYTRPDMTSVRLLKDPATASSRIFVGHIQTEEISKLDLESHFSKYGTVVGSLINRGFGFVQFDDEQAAKNAIQHENGAMFKGRRIDVKPAKKDSQAGGPQNNMISTSGSMSNTSMLGRSPIGSNNQFPPGNNQFNNSANNSFNNRNQSFDGGSQNFNSMDQDFTNDEPLINIQKDIPPNQGKGSDFFEGNANKGNFNDRFAGQAENRNDSNEMFNNTNQNRGPNNQFGQGNSIRNNNAPFNQGGNLNRPAGNQLRNFGNPNNQIQGGPPGGPQSGQNSRRGTRGGKNRNKNKDNNAPNNFRERSPLNRGPRMDDNISGGWDLNKSNDRIRGNFNREPITEVGKRFERGPALNPRDMNLGFNNAVAAPDYAPAVPEKNDCEIIVVNKGLTEYAESIEIRLKKLGLMVDLLFPNDDVLLRRVLGNIASRGCLYAVVVTPTHQEHRSLTLNILHGLPQEHRNMPMEDAINLISRDFANYKAGGRPIPLNTTLASGRHPDAIQVLLNMLADNHQLTVLQYDRLLKYLEIKREEQVQTELGDVKDLPSTTLPVSDPKQAELQSRILNILNSNKTNSNAAVPSPVPAPNPVPVSAPATTWGTASTSTAPATSTATGMTPSPLLNDPTVQKALDSLLQGNLLKNIGEQQTPSATSAPLFAAFPNVGRN